MKRLQIRRHHGMNTGAAYDLLSLYGVPCGHCQKLCQPVPGICPDCQGRLDQALNRFARFDDIQLASGE